MSHTKEHSRKITKWEAYLFGVASLFDFTASLGRRRRALHLPSPNESLSGDWQAIGADIRQAIHRFSARNSE